MKLLPDWLWCMLFHRAQWHPTDGAAAMYKGQFDGFKYFCVNCGRMWGSTEVARRAAAEDRG